MYCQAVICFVSLASVYISISLKPVIVTIHTALLWHLGCLYMLCPTYPVFPLENLLDWSWKLWLSSEDHRYHKALKTLLGYVKILDSPFKGELGFLKTSGLYSGVEFACVHVQVLMYSFPKRLFIHFILFRFLYLHLTHCNLYVTALYLLVWWILF